MSEDFASQGVPARHVLSSCERMMSFFFEHCEIASAAISLDCCPELAAGFTGRISPKGSGYEKPVFSFLLVKKRSF